MKTNIKTIPMFGPSIGDPSKIVDRDVPEADVSAYELAGYKKGVAPKAESKADVKPDAKEEPKAAVKAKSGKK